MNDNTELKRLADELIAANDLFNESPQDNEAGDVWSLANDRFTEAASPEVILALIADNDRLESEAVYAAAGFDAAREEVARLKAENERQAAQYKEWQASHHANYCKVAEERDELRAENAGFKTGYEAYDRANAELKAECARSTEREIQQLAEIEALRQIISDSATSCGAAVSVECTLDFMKHLPVEIFSVISKLRNALAECANSLQGEMLQKFGGQLPEDMHPVTRREYDRDMAEVAGYRAALGKGEQS